MIVKTDFKECPYITAGKEYKVEVMDNGCHFIVDDEGFKMVIRLNESNHWLFGNTWADQET